MGDASAASLLKLALLPRRRFEVVLSLSSTSPEAANEHISTP
jgi:hypothetical protein